MRGRAKADRIGIGKRPGASLEADVEAGGARRLVPDVVRVPVDVGIDVEEDESENMDEENNADVDEEVEGDVKVVILIVDDANGRVVLDEEEGWIKGKESEVGKETDKVPTVERIVDVFG